MVRSVLFPKFKEELPRVDGKVFAITGTTSGIGYAAARTAAELGGEVLMLNRKSSRVEDATRKLREEVPSGKFVNIECDLQDFTSVRRAIREIKSSYPSLYCLANNAGIAAAPDRATIDGYDPQMQTNHLSHFLLTAELFPLLEKEANANGDSRIVNHSSQGRHHTANSGLEEKYFGKNGGNLGGDNDLGGSLNAPRYHRYFQTKLANSVFTYGLHEKLQERKSAVRALCCHPGLSSTSIGDHLWKEGWKMKFVEYVVMPLFSQSSEDGAIGLLKGMLHPDAESGVLYGPTGRTGVAVPNPPKPYENDPNAINMIWRMSEEATGVTFLS